MVRIGSGGRYYFLETIFIQYISVLLTWCFQRETSVCLSRVSTTGFVRTRGTASTAPVPRRSLGRHAARVSLQGVSQPLGVRQSGRLTATRRLAVRSADSH